MSEVRLVVPGAPVTKGRPRRGKHGWYTPSSTAQYEDHVAWVARAQPVRFRDVDVHVTIEIWKRGNVGDLDNYAKSILDGLQKGDLFENDRQVKGLEISRVKPSATADQKAVITVREA